MVSAADPSYPLYPIACILSAGVLLPVLLTNFVRQRWNLGVAFLGFWLFFENLTHGINAIIWADNADIKLYVYCDIYSHLQVITGVVKPMATLIITRRLYLITSLQSVTFLDRTAKRRDLVIDWVLGLVIPVIVAGPFYNIVQEFRFQVDEGFGCGNAADDSVLAILLLNSWTVIPPMVSITVYYPRVALCFYRHNREMNRFMQSKESEVSRTNYFRILALASIDIILTLPMGITTLVLSITQSLSLGPLVFYYGWAYDHSAGWEPVGFSYAELAARWSSSKVQYYFNEWTSPVLAFVIFGLFGFTLDARALYWRIICTLGEWFGWKPTLRRARTPLGDIEFGERSQDMSLGLESHPSYIDPGVRAQEQDVESEHGHAATSERESSSDTEVVEDVHRVSDDIAHAEPPLQHLDPYEQAIG